MEMTPITFCLKCLDFEVSCIIYIYKYCFKSIPFSKAIRVKRICSTVETTKQRLWDLRHHLKRRGYNDTVIESGFSKASEINRNDLLEYKGKKINKRLPLALTYHPSLEQISGIVRHHWKEIEKSETLAKLFPEPPVVAFRRPKSNKDTLVRAAVSRPSSTVGQCKPCGDKRCKCCLQLRHAQLFHSKTTGKEYKIFCNVNCKTPNVVLPPWLSRLRVAIRTRKCPTIQQKNEWTQKWPYEKDALARESTLCVAGALIGWLW